MMPRVRSYDRRLSPLSLASIDEHVVGVKWFGNELDDMSGSRAIGKIDTFDEQYSTCCEPKPLPASKSRYTTDPDEAWRGMSDLGRAAVPFSGVTVHKRVPVPLRTLGQYEVCFGPDRLGNHAGALAIPPPSTVGGGDGGRSSRPEARPFHSWASSGCRQYTSAHLALIPRR